VLFVLLALKATFEIRVFPCSEKLPYRANGPICEL